jgi:hypothetical protein
VLSLGPEAGVLVVRIWDRLGALEFGAGTTRGELGIVCCEVRDKEREEASCVLLEEAIANGVEKRSVEEGVIARMRVRLKRGKARHFTSDCDHMGNSGQASSDGAPG